MHIKSKQIKSKQIKIKQIKSKQSDVNQASTPFAVLAATCTLAVTLVSPSPAVAQLQEAVPFTGCFVEWSSGNRLNLDSICSESTSSFSVAENSAGSSTSSQGSSDPKTVIFINRTSVIAGDAAPRRVSPTGFVPTSGADVPGAYVGRDYYYQPNFGIRGNLIPGFRRRLLEPIEFSPVPIISQ
ncbi:MAG: hypothetical protein AAFR12_20970 [Cyanobacteria bacterium J06626_6]